VIVPSSQKTRVFEIIQNIACCCNYVYQGDTIAAIYFEVLTITQRNLRVKCSLLSMDRLLLIIYIDYSSNKS
jgi:hypothetical protein